MDTDEVRFEHLLFEFKCVLVVIIFHHKVSFGIEVVFGECPDALEQFTSASRGHPSVTVIFSGIKSVSRRTAIGLCPSLSGHVAMGVDLPL